MLRETVSEFATRRQLNPRSVRRWCEAGKLHAEQTPGGTWVIINDGKPVPADIDAPTLTYEDIVAADADHPDVFAPPVIDADLIKRALTNWFEACHELDDHHEFLRLCGVIGLSDPWCPPVHWWLDQRVPICIIETAQRLATLLQYAQTQTVATEPM